MILAVEELTDPERVVLEAVERGRLVELPLNKPEVQDPAEGATWGPERAVRAELLIDILTGAWKSKLAIVRVLKLRGARISGSLDLGAAELVCPVVFQGCFFEQPVLLTEARAASIYLHGCYLPELNAEQLTTRGNFELNAWRPGQDEVAIPFWTDRGVNLDVARIGGQLGLIGATLVNSKGPALSGNGLTVDQGMFCSDGFRADGGVDLTAAHIGWLDFDGATLANSKGPALSGNSLTVDQRMFCRKGFRGHGGVTLTAAHIGGTLEFHGATLVNSRGPALTADTLTVDRSMFCRDGFRADGGVDLTAAHIGGTLDFSGATLANSKGPALIANSLTVDKTMSCGEGFRADGEVDLTDSRVSILHDDKPSWPRRLHLEGFNYKALEATGKISARERLDWLERTFPPVDRTSRRNRRRSLWRDSTQYSPQPYEQLAAMYRELGRPEDARMVLIAKQRRRRRAINPLAKLWNSLLDWTVGFGYQTWRAGLWLLVLVGLGWWIFDRAHPAHLVAAKPPGQRPWFHAGVYALDLLLPFADLGYQGAWIAGEWARSVYLGWNLAGWVLVTAVVAALSGLTKRD